MWYAPTNAAAASGQVISTSEMKSRLRVDISDDDTLIDALIAEVTTQAESWCGLFILRQTVMALCDSFADFAVLPIAPLAEDATLSITYVDQDGADQTLSPSVYELRVDGLTSAIVLRNGQSWPSIETGSRITAEVETGFETVPLPIKSAIALKVAERYENRENYNSAAPMEWDSLLVNYRR